MPFSFVWVLVKAGARSRPALAHSESLASQAAPGTAAAADWQWLPPGHVDLPLSSPDMWQTSALSAIAGKPECPQNDHCARIPKIMYTGQVCGVPVRHNQLLPALAHSMCCDRGLL